MFDKYLILKNYTEEVKPQLMLFKHIEDIIRTSKSDRLNKLSQT